MSKPRRPLPSDSASEPRASSSTNGATAALARAHHPRLFVCAYQLLGDPQAAEQVVSETLHHAVAHGIGSSEPGQAANGLTPKELERLLIQAVMQHLKAAPAAPSDSNLRALGDAEFDRTGEPSGTRQTERTAMGLSVLPVEARVLVMLVIMQGRSLSEAAELLQKSEACCRFLLNHGRKLLRRVLQRDLLCGDGPDCSDGPHSQAVRGGGTTTLYDLRRNKKAIARA